MSENDYNPEGLTEDQIRIKLLEEQAQGQARELSNTIDRLNAKTEMLMKLESKVYKAFEIVKNAVEFGDIDADEQWLAEVGSVLGWQMENEIEVSFTISGTATVKLPIGKTLDDYSFSASGLSIDSDGWDNEAEVSVDDYNIDDFDEN